MYTPDVSMDENSENLPNVLVAVKDINPGKCENIDQQDKVVFACSDGEFH